VAHALRLADARLVPPVIGVFDSGFGGLGVLRHLRTALPTRDFTYLGDSGRAPYGGRDVNTLLDFSEQAVERLFDEGCRLVVVACNTVSCVALRHLQRRYCPPQGDRRILGVTIPGAEAAAAVSRGRVGVLATARTVASGTYVTEIHKVSPHLNVTQAAAPLLAPVVEEGWEETEIADAAVRRYLARLPDIDTLLLGCTHYPLLATAFARHLPAEVTVVDPAPQVATRLVDWLARHPQFDAPGAGALQVCCTGDPDAFAAHGGRFLGAPLPPVTAIAEVGGRLAPRAPGSLRQGQIVRDDRA
jgi:glutamate racemase